MKTFTIIVLSVVVVILAALLLSRPVETESDSHLAEPMQSPIPEVIPDLPEPSPVDTAESPEVQAAEVEEAPAEEQASVIAGLNDEGGNVDNDLRIVSSVFFSARTVFKKNPLGTHEEIIAFLQGDNPRGIAYLPKEHPALRDGKLVDRWGTPFFFHAVSSRQMDIHSAGPDGVMWSADDAVLKSGG
jgi:hypothetical protein